MRQSERGSEGREKKALFRFGCLPFAVTSSSTPSVMQSNLPHHLSLLSLYIYLCIITMLPSLISPETAKFSAKEASSLSLLSTREYVGEIKRVPRKAGVRLQPSNKGSSGGLAQTCYTMTEHSRNQGRDFLTQGKMWPGLKAEVGHLWKTCGHGGDEKHDTDNSREKLLHLPPHPQFVWFCFLLLHMCYLRVAEILKYSFSETSTEQKTEISLHVYYSAA